MLRNRVGLFRRHRGGGGAARFEALESRQLFSATIGNIVLHNDLQILGDSAGGADIQGFTPAQIRTAYGFDGVTFNDGKTTGDGSGQTIAIVDAYSDPYIQTDLGVFDQQFGIAAPPSFKVVNQSGGSTLPVRNPDWAGEISLDVEWAHAIAPGANILLVEASTPTIANLMSAVNYARHAPGVSAVSMSWGGSEFFSFNGAEFTGETTLDPTFTTPSGHTGVTFVASAGDSGSYSGVQWPAVSPNVLSVGGTSLTLSADNSYQSETSWIGTSGGYSVIEPTPNYQSKVDFTPHRSSPDVAYVADPNTGVAVFDSYADDGYVGWQEVGGTSAGAPQWAALIAIADQGRSLAGKGTLDGNSQTLPMIYDLYSAPGSGDYSTYTKYFHDIIDPSDFYDAAGPGYDQLTGLGTPKAENVVDDLAGIPLGSEPSNPASPVQPSQTPSPVAATIVSNLPSSAVGSTTGSFTLRLFNSTSSRFAGPLAVALYATRAGTIASSDAAFETITLPHVSIPTNTAKLVTIHFTYPTSVPAGSYLLAASITATGDNTAATQAIAPSATNILSPVTNLSEKSLQSSLSITPGALEKIKLKITNDGNITAAGALTIDLYSGEDPTLDSTDALITSLETAINLHPGKSEIFKLRFTAPSSTTSYLLASASSTVRPQDVFSTDKLAVIAISG